METNRINLSTMENKHNGKETNQQNEKWKNTHKQNKQIEKWEINKPRKWTN